MRVVESQPAASQRELALSLGISLGKTNYLIKALLSKGWVKAQNFRRSDNKLGYLYLLTPSGIAEKSRLTRTFLSHKEREYLVLQEEIANLRKELEGTDS